MTWPASMVGGLRGSPSGINEASYQTNVTSSPRSVAAKHGRKVSVLNWHDCTLPGKNIEDPGDCEPYDPNDNRRKNRKKELVKLFNRAVTKIHKDDYDLSILYTDSLKKTASSRRPQSDKQWPQADSLNQISDGLKQTGFRKKNI